MAAKEPMAQLSSMHGATCTRVDIDGRQYSSLLSRSKTPSRQVFPTHFKVDLGPREAPVDFRAPLDDPAKRDELLPVRRLTAGLSCITSHRAQQALTRQSPPEPTVMHRRGMSHLIAKLKVFQSPGHPFTHRHGMSPDHPSADNHGGG